MLKRNLYSPFLKNTSIYLCGSLISAGVPFLLLPILTRHLNPSEYGYVSMFTLLLSIVGVFTGLSVQGSIAREYFNENINFKEFVFNCILLLFISTLCVMLLFLLFIEYISKWSSLSDYYLYAIVGISFFQFLSLIVLALYQIQAKAKEYSFMQIFQSSGTVLLSIFFIVYCEMDWQGRALAQILTMITIGLVSCKILYKDWIVIRVNKEYLKIALSFGLPLIPHSLGGTLVVVADRLIINNSLGVYDVGIYTAGLQIGKMMSLVTSSISNGYTPIFYKCLNESNDTLKKKIVLLTYIYFIGLLVLAFIIGFFAPLLVKYILGKNFFASANIIFWIALGEAFNGMYLAVVGYIFYVRKTIGLAIITFVSGVTCIVSTYLLVQIMGIEGAAIAYSISLLTTFLLTWIYAIKNYKMPWFVGNVK
ncbi:oligosaccharide flippase family protein [Sulfurospirillum cavolei]|uniref:oligosaccharide flippase family protein n=1 Tax=Sulfurospirillum cavolei TaxID=366522 RepID=UPI000764ACB0|nr:oligosaccharide flippase family protein [Sulfurospirillum cavolei]